MNQHTPGPWYEMTKGNNEYQSAIAQEATGKTVALTYTSNDADARLIAAAPELLEALEDACLTYAVHGEQPPEKWLAAIAHATGEQVNR